MKTKSTLEKIEDGAVNEFSQYGFDGARMDRIAKKAGINKAMIYYHFKGKEKLYEHILEMIFSRIYDFISPLIPETPDSPEDFERLLRGYSSYLGKIDENFVRIMLRELSTGGKYFKKIIIPLLIQPVIKRVTEMFINGREKGLFSDLNPIYTMIQLIGSIVFFNMLRVTMKDSEIADMIFTGEYVSAYTENLFRIYSGGIFSQ